MNKQFLKHQLHTGTSSLAFHLDLVEKFANSDKRFMLVKVMATRRRDCSLPRQPVFFDTIEELTTAYNLYHGKEVSERGLDVLFVDAYEWDLGVNRVTVQ